MADYTAILNLLSTLVEELKSSDAPWVSRSEYINLADAMVDMLAEGIQVIGDVIVEGKPYPASELESTSVLATTVSLEWTAAIGNDVVQWLERSDNAGVDWAILDDDVSGNTYIDTTVSAESDYLYRIGAYVPIGNPIQKKIVWRYNEHLGTAYPADITVGLTDLVMIPCSQDGRIIDVGLFVDDKTKLSETEWITAEYDGKLKKTIGKKYLALQIDNYNTNGQPYYVLMDHDEKSLTGPHQYDLDIDNFVDFLEKGIEEFNKNHPS